MVDQAVTEEAVEDEVEDAQPLRRGREPRRHNRITGQYHRRKSLKVCCSLSIARERVLRSYAFD